MSLEVQQLIDKTNVLTVTAQDLIDESMQCRKDAAENWGNFMAAGMSPSGFYLAAQGNDINVRASRLVLSDSTGVCIAHQGINRQWTAGTGMAEPGLSMTSRWAYVWLVSDGEADLQVYLSSSPLEPVGIHEKYKYWRYCASVWIEADGTLRFMTKNASGQVTWLGLPTVQDAPIGAATWKEFNHDAWCPPHIHNVQWDVASGNTHGCFRVSWVNGGGDDVHLMTYMHTDDWTGYQIDMPLSPDHKSLWLYTLCGNQHIRVSIRGYKETAML